MDSNYRSDHSAEGHPVFMDNPAEGKSVLMDNFAERKRVYVYDQGNFIQVYWTPYSCKYWDKEPSRINTWAGWSTTLCKDTLGMVHNEAMSADHGNHYIKLHVYNFVLI